MHPRSRNARGLGGKCKLCATSRTSAKTDFNKVFDYVTCLTLSKYARIVLRCTLCLTPSEVAFIRFLPVLYSEMVVLYHCSSARSPD
jgi:hypothetical protein